MIPLRADRWSDWVLAQFERYRHVAFAALLLTYLAGFNGQWRPEPDSALYLSLGRNLAEGKGYTYQGQPHHLAYPGWPWVLSGIFRLSSGHAIFFAHLAIFLMALASLALCYRLMLLHAGRAMAVLMTFGLGISHTFYRYSFEVRSDMPFMLGVMAVLAGYEGVLGGGKGTAENSELASNPGKPRNILRLTSGESGSEGELQLAPSAARPHLTSPEGRGTGSDSASLSVSQDSGTNLSLPSGESRSEGERLTAPSGRKPRRSFADWLLLTGGLIIAVVTRPTMWTLLLALFAAVAWGIARGRIGKKTILVLLIVPLCAAAFLLIDPREKGTGKRMGDYEDVLIEAVSWQKLGANIHELLDPMASEALFGIDFGKALRVEPVSLQMIGSVVAIFVGLLAFRERPLWGLWFVFTVLMMVVVLARDRYFLPVLPIMIFGWWTFIRRVNLRFPGRAGNVTFIILFALGAVPNCAKVGELFIEQRHPNVLTVLRDGRYESIGQFAAVINQNVPENGWVIAPKKFGRILTFLSRRNVIEREEAEDFINYPRPLFVIRPMEFIADDPLSATNSIWVGPALGTVKGPFDPQPWSLHLVGTRESVGQLGKAGG